MLYYAWDMAHDWCNCFFSFCAIFCPLTPLTAQKMKISKKWKKYLEISSFYTSVPKVIIICYTFPEIWRVTDVTVFVFLFFFSFLAVFCHFTHLKAKKIKNFSKIKKTKTPGRYHHLTQVYQKSWSYTSLFLKYDTWQMSFLFYTTLPKIIKICYNVTEICRVWQM